MRAAVLRLAGALGIATALTAPAAARVSYETTDSPRGCIARVLPDQVSGAIGLIFRTNGTDLTVEFDDVPANRAARTGAADLVAGDTRMPFRPLALADRARADENDTWRLMASGQPVHLTLSPPAGAVQTARFDDLDPAGILAELERRCPPAPDLAAQRAEEARLSLAPEDIRLINTILLAEAGGSVLPAQASDRLDERARSLIDAFSRRTLGAPRRYLNRALFEQIMAAGGFRVAPRFEDARRFADGVAPVKQGGKWGIVDARLNWIVLPEFDAVPSSFNGHVPVMKDGAWGVIDPAGRLTHPLIYERVLPCRERRCAFRQDGRWGFLDPMGGVAIRAKYRAVRGFGDGYAAVRDDRGWVLIDRTGRSAGRYEGVSDLYSPVDGMIRFADRSDRWGFLRTDGRLSVQPVYDGAKDFGEGLAPVRRGAWWGFIDRAGRQVIRPQFRDAAPFSEGLAAVQATSGLWGYVDARGRWAIAPKYLSAFRFRDGIAVVRVENPMKPGATDRADWLRGFIDKRGGWVYRPIFEDVWAFQDSLAPVKVLGRWGYLDLGLIRARR